MKAKPGYKLVQSQFRKYEEIPERWILSKLNKICDKISVGIATSTTKHFVEKGVPLLRNQNIKNGYIVIDDLLYISKEFAEMNKSKKLQEGDVICMRTGYPGQSAVVPSKMVGWQTFTTLIIRPCKKIINSQFLMIFLNSLGRKQISSIQAGAAQQNLNVGWLSNMSILLPSLSEQQKIVSILSNVDDLISYFDNSIESTEKLKKGLMQTLLTRGIGHKKFKKVKWFYGKEIEIPEDWNILHLTQISKIIDSLHITPKYSSKGFPMVRSTEIKLGDLKLDDAFRVSKKIYDQFTFNHVPRRNDIVMSRVGTYFVTSFVNTDEQFCMGQNTLIIHPEYDSRYLYNFLNSFFIQKQIEFLFDRTSGQKSMSLKNIRELKIFLPLILEQQKISSIFSKIDVKINYLESKKSNLENLKKGLMQKLLIGQIRVKI
jgi:type I restriction enzyme, S subunit